MSPQPVPGLSWSADDHLRHFMYNDIVSVLQTLSWENRTYDVLDFGSMWFGDPDGGWQTHMRWILKDVLGSDRLNHILATYPEYNIETLSIVNDNSMDILVADQVLEHVERPWLAAQQIHRTVKRGGIAVVATPGLYPIHPSPLDCWRIMPDGYRVLFPDDKWTTLTLNMWGNAARVGFEFSENEGLLSGAPTFTVNEALSQDFFTEGNDGRSPMQIWWIGMKR